jgi:hypothetical protein
MQLSNLFRALPVGGACMFAFATTVSAGGLGDLAGGADLSSLASGSAGNAAGVIEYCMKNNYLGGDAASSMKDKLMGKVGGDSKDAASDEGFVDGAKGLVKTKDGKSVDLANLGGSMGGMSGVSDMKSKATKKACSTVLDHAKSLL